MIAINLALDRSHPKGLRSIICCDDEIAEDSLINTLISGSCPPNECDRISFTPVLTTMTHSPIQSQTIQFKLKRAFMKQSFVKGTIVAFFLGLMTGSAQALPNGTWLSKPQIAFHTSNGTLDQVMARMQNQRYKYIFLDVRNVSDEIQQQVTQKIRQYQMVPVVWVQSPQLRSMTVSDLVHEARYADGIQVDDHFFSNYSRFDFSQLRAQYSKPIFCSIQPFQSHLVPAGCNQLDLQCYTPQSFKSCIGLADRLRAVASLSTENTLKYQYQLGSRAYNTFLWPHTNEFRAATPSLNPPQSVANLP